MEQIGEEYKTIFNSADFQKFPIKDWADLYLSIHSPNGLKLLTRLRFGLSHLNEHKFNHNFKDYVYPL